MRQSKKRPARMREPVLKEGAFSLVRGILRICFYTRIKSSAHSGKNGANDEDIRLFEAKSGTGTVRKNMKRT